MQSEKGTSSIASFYVMNENIIVVELLNDAVIDLAEVKQTSVLADAYINKPQYLVMLDTSNHNTWEIPAEVLKYLANNEFSPKQIAFAIVLNSLPMRFFARFFISFHKPTVPTKLFTSKERAKKWLLGKLN
jgi:hypothetical protein